jgi:hypothetical protein
MRKSATHALPSDDSSLVARPLFRISTATATAASVAATGRNVRTVRHAVEWFLAPSLSNSKRKSHSTVGNFNLKVVDRNWERDPGKMYDENKYETYA